MSFTFVDSDGADASGSSTTIATPGITVHAGDVVVVLAKWEGTTTTATCSDGTSTLTAWVPGVVANTLNVGSNNEPFLDAFYILASVASGTNAVVYTVTFGTSVPFRNIVVMSFTPSGTVTLDGTAVAGFGAGTAIASGNITTTGTDGLAVASYATYGGIVTSPQINGVAAAHTQLSGADRSLMWNITYAAGFTGEATGTIGVNFWNVGVIAFKNTATADGQEWIVRQAPQRGPTVRNVMY